jgi:hypothetical protein
VNQISGTVPTDAPVQAQDASAPTQPAGAAPAPAAAAATEPASVPSDGFQSRGRARRRARFLRKARELAYRDLGGLVFNLHRFGARNDALVLAKLTTLTQIDAELRAIEGALGERRPITVLREAGITACPRCAAIHGSEDSFCPNCGLSMGRHVDLPIAGAAAAPTVGAAAAATAPQAAPAPTPAPGPIPAPVAAAINAPTPAAPFAPTPPNPPDPARAPAPARPSGATSAPQPVPASATGRAPTPPASAQFRAPSTPPPSPSPAPAAPEEDGPTEILRPPTSGS